MTSKPNKVEIPENASEQVVRLQLDEITKAIKQARIGNKNRITVTIQQQG